MGRIQFREEIGKQFNLEELITICHDLGIDYENLPGNTKQRKVLELLDFCYRVRSTKLLLTRLEVARPKTNWLELLIAFDHPNHSEKELEKTNSSSKSPDAQMSIVFYPDTLTVELEGIDPYVIEQAQAALETTLKTIMTDYSTNHLLLKAASFTYDRIKSQFDVRPNNYIVHPPPINISSRDR